MGLHAPGSDGSSISAPPPHIRHDVVLNETACRDISLNREAPDAIHLTFPRSTGDCRSFRQSPACAIHPWPQRSILALLCVRCWSSSTCPSPPESDKKHGEYVPSFLLAVGASAVNTASNTAGRTFPALLGTASLSLTAFLIDRQNWWHCPPACSESHDWLTSGPRSRKSILLRRPDIFLKIWRTRARKAFLVVTRNCCAACLPPAEK